MEKYLARFILFMVYVGICWIEPLFLTKFTYEARVGIIHGIIAAFILVVWAIYNCEISVFKKAGN